MDSLVSSSSGLGPVRGLRTFSRRRSRRIGASSPGLMTSFSYRRDRAKRRQIFLKTYRLGSVKRLGSSSAKAADQLKKAVSKVKAVLVSVLSLSRFRSLVSCNSRTATAVSHPREVKTRFLGLR